MYLKKYIPFPEENRQKLLPYKEKEKACSGARGWWIYSRFIAPGIK